MENRLQNGKYDTTLIEGPMWKCGTRVHTRTHTHTHTHTHTLLKQLWVPPAPPKESQAALQAIWRTFLLTWCSLQYLMEMMGKVSNCVFC